MAQLIKPQVPGPSDVPRASDWNGIWKGFGQNTAYLRSLVLYLQTHLNRVYNAVVPLQYAVATIAVTDSPYSLAETDVFIAASAGASGDTTINLPAATGSGRSIIVKKLDANAHNVTIKAVAGDTIDGGAQFYIGPSNPIPPPNNGQYFSVSIIDATAGQWLII